MKPWFLLQSTCWIDIQIAKAHGRFLWEYYQQTTKRQRHFSRLVFYVEGKRQELLQQYAERQAKAERGN